MLGVKEWTRCLQRRTVTKPGDPRDRPRRSTPLVEGKATIAGHSKHDALNSPFLHALTCGNRFLRLAATQAVMRFPFNTRSLFGVPRLRNPKGIGLFAHAWLDFAGHLRRRPGEGGGMSADGCSLEAEKLLSWLVRQASPQARPSERLARAFGAEGHTPPQSGTGRLKGLGWGYHYDWQDKGFFQPAHFPNRVVSCWIGFAFLRACEITGEEKYLAAAREIASFLLENPRRLVETADQLCLSYVPIETIDWAVMDVSALVAAFCSKLAPGEALLWIVSCDLPIPFRPKTTDLLRNRK